jgi:hypothetical protein
MYHTEKKNTVTVELYDLTLNGQSGKRFGRVVPTRTLNEDDLINIAVNRRTDLHAETLRASFDLLKNIAMEEIANGSHVEFGLGHFGLIVKGAFTGDRPEWNPAANSLRIKLSLNKQLNAAIDTAKINIRGMANAGAIVNSLTDKISGEINTRLTPSGGIILSGSKIKVTGNNPANGIRFINQATQAIYTIPKELLIANGPTNVSLIVPPDLPPGNYKLELTTQYTTSPKPLKEPRTYLLNSILAVR